MGIYFPRTHTYARKGGCPDQALANLGDAALVVGVVLSTQTCVRVSAVAGATGLRHHALRATGKPAMLVLTNEVCSFMKQE